MWTGRSSLQEMALWGFFLLFLKPNLFFCKLPFFLNKDFIYYLRTRAHEQERPGQRRSRLPAEPLGLTPGP